MASMTCKVCAGEWPGKEQKIADLELSAAYLFEDQFFPGWTVVVLKRHATELYDLLGNQVPHVHWHVIPRLTDDPSPREAVWTVAHKPSRLTPEARDERIARI